MVGSDPERRERLVGKTVQKDGRGQMLTQRMRLGMGRLPMNRSQLASAPRLPLMMEDIHKELFVPARNHRHGVIHDAWRGIRFCWSIPTIDAMLGEIVFRMNRFTQLQSRPVPRATSDPSRSVMTVAVPR